MIIFSILNKSRSLLLCLNDAVNIMALITMNRKKKLKFFQRKITGRRTKVKCDKQSYICLLHVFPTEVFMVCKQRKTQTMNQTRSTKKLYHLYLHFLPLFIFEGKVFFHISVLNSHRLNAARDTSGTCVFTSFLNVLPSTNVMSSQDICSLLRETHTATATPTPTHTHTYKYYLEEGNHSLSGTHTDNKI